MARFNFNIEEQTDFEGGGNYEPIPEGEYELMCEEAEEKDTKSGGTMIKAKFRVLGPEFKNRVIYANFNVVNRSEKAQEIGRRQVATWARAVGKPNAQDTDELLMRPFIGVVSVEAGSGQYGPSNRIDGFKAKEGGVQVPKASAAPSRSAPAPSPAAQAGAPVAAPSAAASPSKPSGKKAPWED